MSDSSDKPMLGGCCICLDERGWDENPLVYCDGSDCSIAVHQACYGIVSVPSGPWFCRRCEVHDSATQLSCVLCHFQGGAMKQADDKNHWAHVVCALYIPEVEFGNVSSMEPIVVDKVPEERYKKWCYICSEGDPKKCVGACMDCNKSGCKLSFHVTCAQITGLLCEEGGASNTTKYCGYCAHHLPKQKKMSPFKNLACAKVYHKPSDKIEPHGKVAKLPYIKPTEQAAVSADNEAEQQNHTSLQSAQGIRSDNEVKHAISINPLEVTPLETPLVGGTLSSLADVASSELEKQTMQTSCELKRKDFAQKSDNRKKVKRKPEKVFSEKEGNSVKKMSKPNKTKLMSTDEKPQKIKSTITPPLSELEQIGYATAPKHSVISLSEFGHTSLEPSNPSDIGETKPTPNSRSNRADGLAAIEQLMEHNNDELMGFFQEFGMTNNVSQLLQTLKKLREEINKMESAVERMTHQRDQLLAIKARLSMPLHPVSFSRVCSNPSSSSTRDTKQFTVSSHEQQGTSSYPYFVNKM